MSYCWQTLQVSGDRARILRMNLRVARPWHHRQGLSAVFVDAAANHRDDIVDTPAAYASFDIRREIRWIHDTRVALHQRIGPRDASVRTSKQLLHVWCTHQ